ncbi:MAG: ABC transporter permease [Verrucomicrobiota bacterium]|jgi:molybdate transport system permease protein|nr:ABC transporter permease [Verrucomicrobiota bacterium]MEE2735125.1 ABC transporter permease [Verrucomicrobiota bacterium]
MASLARLFIGPWNFILSLVRDPNARFWFYLALSTAGYVLFIVAMLVATAVHSTPGDLLSALQSREIQHSIYLSLLTCSLTALLSLLAAVPIGYLLARCSFFGKALVESILDIPIVLPPMVIGLCLLILFQTGLGGFVDSVIPFTYTVFGVVLAQFVIGVAFAIRTMRGTFDQLSQRPEDVAMTLGCSRGGAMWRVTLPAAGKGMVAAASVAWARSLGEFGPVLVFAGATRMKTEVLPTTVWLELSVGNLEGAIAVSLLMVLFAMVVLVAMRLVGERW